MWVIFPLVGLAGLGFFLWKQMNPSYPAPSTPLPEAGKTLANFPDLMTLAWYIQDGNNAPSVNEISIFQTHAGIAVTGVMDAATAKAVTWYVGKAPTAPPA